MPPSTKEIQSFFKDNNKAISFYGTAVHDYLGARCCLQNALLYPGCFLASQALEKFMKCHILLAKPNESFKENIKGKRSYPLHHLPTLLSKLKERAGLDLTPYMPLCEKLTNAWEAFRYPDSNPSNYSLAGVVITTKILYSVDEMFFNMFDYLPFDGAINARTGILSTLLFNNIQPIKDALIKNNWSYNTRADILSKPIEWWENQPYKKVEKKILFLGVE